MPEGIKRIFQTGLTDTATTDLEGVGTIRWEGNKVYKWVKYVGGAGPVAAVVGNVAAYKAARASFNEVTSDYSSSRFVGAGVLLSVIPEGGYGWIQVAGQATLNLAIESADSGTVTDGVNLGVEEADNDGALCWPDNNPIAGGGNVAMSIDVSEKIIICTFPL